MYDYTMRDLDYSSACGNLWPYELTNITSYMNVIIFSLVKNYSNRIEC